MASKSFQALSFLVIFVSLVEGHAALDHKAYLERYGYLDHARATNDDSDEALIIDSAIKTFQENFHIKPTGILDLETMSAMEAPRCGVPDIINGTNSMQPLNSSKFAYFPDTKWRKTLLSYLLQEGFPEAAKPSLKRAFDEWQAKSTFLFSDTQGFFDHDISIGSYNGDHGDGRPFDGPGRIVGHAWPPHKEDKVYMHFDAAETWWYENGVEIPQNAIDFQSAALHEMGHVLGLAHSNVESAIMFPSINFGQVKQQLDADDIKGIFWLYGN